MKYVSLVCLIIGLVGCQGLKLKGPKSLICVTPFGLINKKEGNEFQFKLSETENVVTITTPTQTITVPFNNCLIITESAVK